MKNRKKKEGSLHEEVLRYIPEVTFRIEQSEALRESEERWREYVDNAPYGVFVTDMEGRYVEINPEALSITGYSRKELLTMRIADLLSPEAKPLGLAHFQRLQRKGFSYGELPFRTRTGEKRWWSVHAKRISSERAIGFCEDITERKRTEEELEKERERLNLALNAANAGLWDWNVVSGEVYFDPRYFTMAGYEANAFPHSFEEWRQRVHPQDLSRCLEAIDSVCSSERLQSFDMDFRFLRGDREWMWIRGYGKVVERSPQGKVIRMVGFHLDNTTQKELEDLLYQERERFRTTLLSIGDGIIATNHKGMVVLMNPVAERLTGYAAREARGRPLKEIFRVENEETREKVRDLADRVLSSGEVVHLGNHVVLLGKEGTRISIEDSAAPIRNVLGDLTGVVVVCSDVTERKERQREIAYLSTHDQLTGLRNRRSMEEAMERLDTKEHLPLGIIVADVNGLKLTNDAFGYAMGDRLLQAAAGVLERACGEEGVVGRIGGDEFAVLLPGGDLPKVEACAENILREAAKVDFGETVIFSLALGYAVKKEQNEDLEKIRLQAENALGTHKLKYGKIMRSRTVERVLHHINLRYDREQVHTEQVAKYSEALSRALGYDEHRVEIVKAAAVLHDIGKIMVPLELLNKKEPLSEEEFALIRKHPETGYQILRSVEEYAGLAEYVLYHHERWDGKGYPEGLRGGQIPAVSRIISVADAYEAMTANRPYQRAKTSEEAVAEMRRCAGTQFDPCLVEIFLEKVLL